MSATLPVTLFHTNDMHGRLEAMARLSTVARRLRAEAAAEGRTAFFWDAGDAADRRERLVSATKGAAFGPILRAMGYTLQAMGNAIALPYGPQAMQAVAARSGFPILAANFRDGDGPLPPGLDECALVPLPGAAPIGVIGLTAPWRGLYEMFGLKLPDVHAVAQRLVAALRAQGAGAIVVLSHLGLSDDRRLAEAVPGIDLIIGAHSHDRLPQGEVHHGVLIAQAGQYAEALGRVDLELEPGRGRVVARSAQVIEVPPDTPPDPAVLRAIAEAEREVEALLAAPIGQLAGALDLDYFAECALGSLAADALRERMGADAALVASGLFHQPLPAGTLTRGGLNAACFATANPGVTPVTGAQLLRALERGLEPALIENRYHGLRGTPVGLPQVSGLVVQAERSGPAGQRVRQVLVDGQPLDPQRVYRLAHTDFETFAEVGYVALEDLAASWYEVPTILPEVIGDYVRRHSPVPAPPAGRWQG